MKNLSVSKRLQVLAVALAMICLSGCYEGWEYDKKAEEKTVTVPGTGEPVKKLFAYTLFEVFYLSNNAVDDSSCFPNTGYTTYKKDEWQARRSAIAGVVSSLSETMDTINHEITDTDCTTLSEIEDAAETLNPSGVTVPTESKAGVYLHMKAVFWDGDAASGSPPATVKSANWAAWQVLETAGFDTKSRHYFSLSNVSSSYHAEWRDALTTEEKLEATPINTPDPSVDGEKEMATIINDDTATFGAWISE
jgi:hypothetical protein